MVCQCNIVSWTVFELATLDDILVGSCKLKHPGEGTLGPAVDIDYCYVGLSIFGRDLSFQIFTSYVTWKAMAAQQGFAGKISLKIPIWRKRAEEVGLLS